MLLIWLETFWRLFCTESTLRGEYDDDATALLALGHAVPRFKVSRAPFETWARTTVGARRDGKDIAVRRGGRNQNNPRLSYTALCSILQAFRSPMLSQ